MIELAERLSLFIKHLIERGIKYSDGANGNFRFACTGQGGTDLNATAAAGAGGKTLLFYHSHPEKQTEVLRSLTSWVVTREGVL